MRAVTPPGTVGLQKCYGDTDQPGVVRSDRVGGALANPDALRIGVA
jgi:hypothetical protein